MLNRLSILRDNLSSSYWFIPALLCGFALFLSIVTIELDKTVGRDLAWVTGLVYVDSPEAARTLLSTVASSMITIAGLVFSLTMVVLSLNSQQYGPLVLGNFMRDRGNQVVLGIFTATFIYTLLVLRTIRGTDDTTFVPHISVLMGLIFSILSLAMLIYFIHHVSQSIQSDQVISRVSVGLNAGIERIFPADEQPAHVDPQAEMTHWEDALNTRGAAVKAAESGYLQLVNMERLVEVAAEHQTIIRLESRPGAFCLVGQTLATVVADPATRETLTEAIGDAFEIGDRRTPLQDVGYLVTQLVSIAVRALSPGINDPYTAVMCIDRLGQALDLILSRTPPSMYRYDDNNQLRVVLTPHDFADRLRTAFDAIRHYGHSDLTVSMRLLEVLGALIGRASDREHLQALRAYAALVYEESSANLASRDDRERLSAVYAQVVHGQ